MSRVASNLVFVVSDQVRHKPGCTVTEEGYWLEVSDLGSCVIVQSSVILLSIQQKRRRCSADMRLYLECFFMKIK